MGTKDLDMSKVVERAELQRRIEVASRNGVDRTTFISLVTDTARHADLGEAYVRRMAEFAAEVYDASAE